MLRSSSILTAAALAVLFITTEEASAQRIRVGVGSGGYGRSYGGYSGYNRGYGGGYYGGNFGQPGISFGIGNVRVGVSPGYSGYSGYRSSYYNPPGTYYAPSDTYYSSPSVTYSQPSVILGSSEEAEPARSETRVQVILPDPNAEIWFDGLKSSSTGEVRNFGFPDDRAGDKNTHTFKATFMRDGRTVTETREVRVNGGSSATVDFTRPEGKNKITPPAPPEEDR